MTEVCIYNFTKIFVLRIVLIFVKEIQRRRLIRPGGRTPITDLTDVEVTLNKSLLKLAAGEGPTFK